MNNIVFKLATRLIAVGAILCYFSSCQFSPKTKNDNNVKFDSIKIEKSYHMLGDKENPNCDLNIEFVYPVSADKDRLPMLQKDFVSAFFGHDYDSLPPKQAIKKYADTYIAEYKDMEQDFIDSKKEHGVDEIRNWYSAYETFSNQIKFNKDDILSFTIYYENYTGGAHGSHCTSHYVIDLENGQFVKEEDIFVEDYQSKLSQIIIHQLTKNYKLSSPEELEDEGIFSVDEIYPNNNFYVDETGITYTYNEYEIAPYVVGAITVHLSYDQIELLLKPDSPITRISRP